MAVNVAALEATLDANVRGFVNGMDKADRELSGFGKQVDQSGSKIEGFVKGAITGVGIEGLRRFATASFNAAADLNESMNAVEVVFGSAAGQIKDFSSTAIDRVGLAEVKVNQSATVLGSALINAGLSADEAATKTIGLTERAADMASVFNTDVDTALQAIQAAIRGEIDPIEKFGVSMNAAQVEAKALAMGLHDGTGEMSAQAKVAARLAVIMDQTDRVAGDYSNTADSAANSSKRFRERLTEIQAVFGQGLVDAFEDLAPALEEAGPAMEELARSTAEVVALLGPLAKGLADSVGWLERHGDLASQVGENLGAAQGSIFDIIGAFKAATGEGKSWNERLEDIGKELTGHVDITQDVQRAIMNNYVDSLERAASSAEDTADETRDLGRTADLTADDIDGLGSALDRLVGDEVDATQAAVDFEQAMADLIEQTDEAGTSLDLASEAGRKNQRAVLDAVSATKDLIDVSMEEATTVDQARDAVARHVSSLRDTLKQAGFTEAQITELVAQYNLVPDQLVTDLTANVQPALHELARLRAALADIGRATGNNVATVTVGGTRGGIVMHDGGVVPGPRGADVPIIAQAGEHITPVGGTPPGGDVIVQVQGFMGTKADIVRAVQEGLRSQNRRSGRTRIT